MLFHRRVYICNITLNRKTMIISKVEKIDEPSAFYNEKKISVLIEKAVSKVIGEKMLSTAKEVFTNKEVMELLGVKDKLLKLYRDNGMLSYSKVNDKYWYRRDDIEEFLKNHRQAAFAVCDEFGNIRPQGWS